MTVNFLRPQNPFNLASEFPTSYAPVEGEEVLDYVAGNSGFLGETGKAPYKITYETDGAIHATFGSVPEWDESTKIEIVDVLVQGGAQAYVLSGSISACITDVARKLYVVYKMEGSDNAADDGWYSLDMRGAFVPVKLVDATVWAGVVAQMTAGDTTNTFTVFSMEGTNDLYRAESSDLSTKTVAFSADNFDRVVSFHAYVGSNLRYQIVFKGIASIGAAP